MKMNTKNVIQHVNAVAMFGVCVLYTSCYRRFYYVEIGIVMWLSSLFFLYFPDFLTIPGISRDEMREVKKISIPAGWVWILWWIGGLIDSGSLRTISSVLLILLIVYCGFYIRRWRKKYITPK
jgi:hypothetical protein